MSSDKSGWDAPGPAGRTQGAYPGQPGGAPPQWQGQGDVPQGHGQGPQWQGQGPQGQGPGSPVGVITEEQTWVTGRRVIQYIVDYVLAGIIPGIAYWLFDRDRGFLSGLGWLIATAIALAVYYWYWVERPRTHAGQTFGMQLFGLRVISKDGRPASTAQLFVRGILLIVDTLFFGLVGLITMLCSRYRQRVGDHAAGTLVVPA
jgi:uncharacterized RDD family membrane protein YckC